MDNVQKQQVVSLTDEFLHELVQELDHENIIGITLGGSYARGRPPCTAMSIWPVSGAKD